MNTHENIILLRSRKESWFLQSFQPLWCRMGETLQQVRVSLFLFLQKSLCFSFTFSLQRFFFGFLYVVDLKLIVSLSHSFLFLISQILQILFLFNPILNPIFLSFHSSAGEKVKKQLSSLPRFLSAQFYQLTRKPGVEEVIQKL